MIFKRVIINNEEIYVRKQDINELTAYKKHEIHEKEYSEKEVLCQELKARVLGKNIGIYISNDIYETFLEE